MAESPNFPRLIGNPNSCDMNINDSVGHNGLTDVADTMLHRTYF